MTSSSEITQLRTVPFVLAATLAAAAGLGGSLDLHRHVIETTVVVHNHSQSGHHHHDDLHPAAALETPSRLPRHHHGGSAADRHHSDDRVEVADRSEPRSGEGPSEQPGSSDCDYLAIGSAAPGFAGEQALAILVLTSAESRPVAVSVETADPVRIAGARAPPALAA